MPPDKALARALAAHRAGRLAEAGAIYRDILQANPAEFGALHLLGVIEYQNARYEQAAALIWQALQVNPRSAEAYSNLGIVYADQQRAAEALACFGNALALRSDYAEALYNRANVLRALKRFAEALADYDRALAQRPGYADAWNNRGIALAKLRRHGEALESHGRALELAPGNPEFHNNRGVALKEVQRHGEALADYEAALALRPDYPEALNNRGQALQACGRYEESLACYTQALALRPAYAEAHTNLGLCRLLLGDYAQGWPEYEWRWKNPALELAPRSFAQPQWDGAQDLRGKRILLHMEQGLGDAIMALRYVPLVAARDAQVVFEVAPALAPLLAGLAGEYRVVLQGAALPETDFHCPLLSLPLAFGTTVESIPAKIPYLVADGEAAAAWRGRLAPQGGMLVGLCWRGNPDYPRDAERSFEFARLAPLFELPGIRFVGLQKEMLDEERRLAATLPRFVHPGADFADTAALLAALDLVITVDTSWGHWAGAIGKPVWVLLPFSPHWPWLTEREDSPWYPTARLFRQPGIGNWNHVVRTVRDELFRGEESENIARPKTR
jgi:tetratricopeptide (TPR) repeat protein